MKHLLQLSLLCVVGCAASDLDIDDGVDDSFGGGGKADAFAEGSAEARGALLLVNDATVTLHELDVEIGLSSRAAKGIVAARPFASLPALDAVPYVGPRTLARLVEVARERGLVVPRLVISHSEASAFESEATLAASPDGQRLLAAWTAPTFDGEWPGNMGPQGGVGEGAIGYAFSTDGGASWLKPGTLAFEDKATPVNVKVAADAQGGFWAVWLGRNNGGVDVPDAIVAAHAAPGATAFDKPVAVTAPRVAGVKAYYDLPAVLAHRGSVLAAYGAIPNGTDECLHSEVARSDDGLTWTRTFVGGCAVIHNYHALCASEASKRIWLVGTVGDPTTSVDIELHHSDDGGRTWSAAQVLSRPGEQVGIDPPVCTADADGVWVVYGTSEEPIDQFRFPMATAMNVVHVSAYGTERFDARDPAMGFAMHPLIVRDGAGATHVMYLAGKRDDDPAGSIRSTRLAKGATAFAPSVAIDGPIKFDPHWGVMPFLGDYFGVAVAGSDLMAAYAIETDGKLGIAFRRWSAR
jgi:hypothetical protein